MFFFFNYTATTETYTYLRTLSLHDALPIYRLISNQEWVDFINDDGYRNPLLWLSEGWARVNAEAWAMPLYWQQRDDTYWTMTLRGAQPIDPAAPVTHLSYYAADAYACWAGKRLPSGAEWEHAADGVAISGNFVESGRLRPKREEEHKSAL